MQKAEYEKLIENIKDFPKPGIVFKDMFPLLQQRFPEVTEDMGRKINWSTVHAVVGIESRGFILGAALAAKHGIGFIPVRKPGKLPPPLIEQSYELEYGTDTLQMKKQDKKLNVVVVDDVLATGGTMKATLSLCEKAGLNVVGVSVLMNLTFLNNLATQVPHVHSVLDY